MFRLAFLNHASYCDQIGDYESADRIMFALASSKDSQVRLASIDKTVLSVADRGWYEERLERATAFGITLELNSAYSKKDGGYIGDPRRSAMKFIEEKGIEPEKSFS